MELNIFDVEHGACALLTCDNGSRIMLDCGHNASTGWYPGSHLRYNGISNIDMLVITNYDEDHVSGIRKLFENVVVKSLLRNKSVSTGTLRNLKSDTGMGLGIDFLCDRVERDFVGPPLSSDIFQGLTKKVYYNDYPSFDDENNLSVAIFLNCHGVTILFAGDLETAGWEHLLKTTTIEKELRSVDVLVASHHGRISGWTEEFRRLCKPFYVVVSDKGYMHATQETLPLYRSITKGGPFRKEEIRHVLTTRRDGMISFHFENGAWHPY